MTQDINKWMSSENLKCTDYPHDGSISPYVMFDFTQYV